MATVNGVLGPIDTADLGFTLMHEHILCCSHSMRFAYPEWVDADNVVERATIEARAAKERGVGTIVDLTPVNLGRDIHVIREVAERAEMQVIAATGLYYHEEPWMIGWEADRIVDFLLIDIERGIQGTDIKAGIIKCATDSPGVTPTNEKLLRVASRLHKASGLPISTHTDAAAKVGTHQQEIFADEGVDLSRVVIGHCGDSDDLDYLESVLGRGSFIGMDRFGLDMILPTDRRVKTIAELCARGYGEQMVLSHDACCYLDFYPPEVFDKVATGAPNWNFRHIPDDVVPALRAGGVAADVVDQMTTGNPRRVFER